MIRAAIMLAVVASCASNSKRVGPFVKSVQVRGHDLVLERCTIEIEGNDVAVGPCQFETRRLPVTATLPPLLEPNIVAGIGANARAAVAECGARTHVTGRLMVRIKVNYAGRLIVAEPTETTGGRDLADCIGSALSSIARFPPSHGGGEAEIPFELGPQ